ncbi:MAG: dienelactone hydrolase family protein [Acidimicrobiia bacterium]|nr:dienelactone hydrolase family protein [Acidimicrobiia bacterium]
MGRIPLALALLLTVLACTDDGSPSTTTTTTRPTVAAGGHSPAPYVEPGPYPVGTYTAEMDGRRVAIWYPATRAAASQPKETLDLVSALLGPEQQSQVPSSLRIPYEVDAHPGAAPARGRRYPVVLFVHGPSGFPEQSVDLTTHLAGWGFVVLAPDVVERSTSDDPTAPLRATLDLATTEDHRAASPLHGIVDTDHVAVTGHAAGAADAFRLAASDDRVDAYIGYAPLVVDGPPPRVPGMVMLATKDRVIPPEENRAVFRALHRPRYEVAIVGAGHLVFTDLCAMGEPVLSASPEPPPLVSFHGLLSRGCTGEHPSTRDDHAAIDDLSVDFLRTALGLQEHPAGLDDPSIARAFAAPVRVTADS